MNQNITKFLIASLVLLSFGNTQHAHSANLNDSGIQFIENQGQVTDQNYRVRKDVLYSGSCDGLIFHLKEKGMSYQFHRFSNWKVDENRQDGEGLSKSFPEDQSIYRTDITWLNINDQYTIEKGRVKEGYYNYYLPSCPDGLTHVNAYESVIYKNIYSKIDLKWYDNNGHLEYDYIVGIGADYKTISWRVEGQMSLTIDDNGSLIIKTPFGDIVNKAPIAFQNNRTVEAKWKIEGDVVSFDIEDVDPSYELIIDPMIGTRIWGTYFGGSSSESAVSLETDNNGNIYMAGYTNSSSGIATSGAFQTIYAGNNNEDGFLVKFNSSGVRQWSTYYGGTDSDYFVSCALDRLGNIYMTGNTESTGMASTGSHQSTYKGNKDGFLVKFSNSGIRLWSTYYGGTSWDISSACATDSLNNVYISGRTISLSDIATPGTHQSVYAGGNDAYLVKFNSVGVRQWGTYFGGSAYDGVYYMCTDGSNPIISGRTVSTGSIASTGAHQTSNGGGSHDAFFAKFDLNGIRLWSTYYGGSAEDNGFGICADQNGNVYATGYTYSSSGISTPNSYQDSLVAGKTAYLVKFDLNGVRQWGTYFGAGSGSGSVKTNTNSVFVSGTQGLNFGIATSGSHQTTKSGKNDAYIARFSSSGSLDWASYYGGASDDYGGSLALANDGAIYFGGSTMSTSGIASSGAHSSIYQGGYDAYITKFKDCTVHSTSISVSECNSYVSPSGNYTWTNSGTYLDTLSNAESCDSVLTIQLTIIKTPITVYQSGKYFAATLGMDSYQWIDCSDSSFIPNATSSSFTASTNGFFAVIVSKGVCMNTSSCFEVTDIGIEERKTYNILIYPNPVKDKLIVDLNGYNGRIDEILVKDLNGREVRSSHQLNQDIIEFDLSNLSAGIYSVAILSEGVNIYMSKIIVKK